MVETVVRYHSMNGYWLSVRSGVLYFLLLGLVLVVAGVRLVDGQAPSRSADASLTAGARWAGGSPGLRP